MDHTKPWLKYVDVSSMDDSALNLDGVKVCNDAGEDLGTIDGFVVDTVSGRPRYLVVDAGGWFTSKHFLVPIGEARLQPGRDALHISHSKEQLSRFPGFDLEEFAPLTERDMSRLNSQKDELPGEAAFELPDWWSDSGAPPADDPKAQADGS